MKHATWCSVHPISGKNLTSLSFARETSTIIDIIKPLTSLCRRKRQKRQKRSKENDYACSKVENSTQFVNVYSPVSDVLVEFFAGTVIAEIFVRVKISYSSVRELFVRYTFSYFKGGVTYTDTRTRLSYATNFRTCSQKCEMYEIKSRRKFLRLQYLILRFFPNSKSSQNIVSANNSNNKVAKNL